MNLAVVLLGAIFGLIVAALKESVPPSRTKRASEPISHRDQYSTLEYYQRRRRQLARRMQAAARLRQRSTLQQAMNVNGKNLVEDWHRSIVSLLKLGDHNLALARQHIERKECKSAVEDASTSVENISRALIHCFGGKPELGSGQEEPLRMLSNRFQGDEKTEFERAVDNVACLSHNRIALKYLSKYDVQIALLDETQAKLILESASRIVHLFKQILTEHFEAEIPELRYEACPHCHSLDTLVWSFNQLTVNYQCNTCRYKWTGPRRNVRWRI